MPFRLGKNPPIADRLGRELKFEKYKAALPFPPAAVNFMSKVTSWPMFDNDTIGDCAEAAFAHHQMGWTWYADKPLIPTLSSVVKAYSAIGGYVPGDPSTDNGSDLQTALKYYNNLGIIKAFAKLKTGNWMELQQAVALFGGVYIGIALPDAVVPEGPGAPDWTTIPWKWQTSWSPNPDNGHCVPVMRYNTAFNDAGIVSWANGDMVMDRPFYENCSDEGWVIVTEEFIKADGESPSGFDLAQLLADQKVVTA
jgi:hypothetical protein